MIQIDKLTKTYTSKNNTIVKALDNINLTLPNNGLTPMISIRKIKPVKIIKTKE